MDSASPLALDDRERLQRVRDAFSSADFTPATLRERLSLGAELVPRRIVPRLLRKLSSDRFGALSTLFLLGLPFSSGTLQAALGPSLVEDFHALGLLTKLSPGKLVSSFRFGIFEDLLLLQETPWSPTVPQGDNQVMSVSASSHKLLQLGIRTPCNRVLELGTGNGLPALVQSAFAKQVVATDCNSRALCMTRFSAWLNNVENLETRQGSLFEPVAGELFDRILMNPPYVISPPREAEPRKLFRDSGLHADGMSEAVVRGLPRYLEPGGFAQCTLDIAHVHGQPWQQRLQSWLQDNDCDAWLLRFDTKPPVDYATDWVYENAESDFARYVSTFDDWLRYFESQKIEAVTNGFLTIRRRSSGTNWFAENESPERIGLCGDAIVRGFQARDFLTSVTTESDLLGTIFELVPDARWVTVQQPSPLDWSQAGSQLRISSGLAFTLSLSGLGMKIVTRIRGPKPLGFILTELAGELQQPLSRLVATSLPLVQTLIEQGFLLPVRRP